MVMSEYLGTSRVRAERIPARGDETDAQVLHVPEAMLRDIEDQAQSLGRDVDWCVNTAWCIAVAEFEANGGVDVADSENIMRGRKRRIRVVLSLLTWRHITQEAERLDRSKSWMLQRAWLIARTRLPVPSSRPKDK
jgi:uncharacterized small protein (TIGR04563 family)